MQLRELALIIAPLLLFGLAIAGVLHVLIREELVVRHLGRPGWRSVVWATLVAVPLPLCSCSVVPVVASLRRKGASDGASVSFLVAAPQIGADSFLLTQGLMGLPFACYRMAASFATALTAGLALDAGRPDAPARSAPPRSVRPHPLPEFVRHVRELVGSLADNLLIGLVVAALILVFLPDGLLTDWQGRGPWLSMAAMAAIGIPLYVCATASTPIAAALVAKGLHPAGALVFLLAGPATNLVTLVMLKSSLSTRAIAVYLGAIAGVALLAGWLMQPLGLSLTLDLDAHHQHDGVAGGGQLLACLVLGVLLADHYLGRLRRRQAPAEAPVPDSDRRRLELAVTGMTCAHCAGRVEAALRGTGLVEEVRVDLAAGRVRVVLSRLAAGDPRPDLAAAVVEAGYEVATPPVLIDN